MIKKFIKFFDDPASAKKFHGWATIFWFIAAFPISIFLNDSIPFLVFISVYAIVVSHWTAWGENGNALDEKKKK